MKYCQLSFMLLIAMTARREDQTVCAKPATEFRSIDDHESAFIQSQIEVLEASILDRLNYNRVPDLSNISSSIEEKRRMIQQYKQYIQEREQKTRQFADDIGDDDSDDVQSKEFYVWRKSDERPNGISPSSWKHKNGHRLFFSNGPRHPLDPTRETHIHSASLKLFKINVRPELLEDTYTVDKEIRINIFQIVSLQNDGAYKRQLIDSKMVSLLEPGWESFDVTKAVRNWLNDDKSNLGLEISSDAQSISSVVDFVLDDVFHTNNSSNTTNIESHDISDIGPTVHLYSQERDILKRTKRRANRKVCSRKDGEKKCCRYPIKISFRDIGWDDWILAPSEYDGYYCAGTCPYTHRMANTFTGIKALLHLKNPDIVPEPCCVATKLSPFTILHYDEEGKYVFTDYPDLVVDKCRCA